MSLGVIGSPVRGARQRERRGARERARQFAGVNARSTAGSKAAYSAGGKAVSGHGSVPRDLALLASDRRRGSSDLARRACAILARVPAASAARIARAVIAAQPSMAAVRNVSARWLQLVRSGVPPVEAAAEVERALEAAQERVIANAAELIENGAIVAAYSHSSSVLAALLRCRRGGRRLRVMCSEGRPMLEGRWFARRLAAEDIPVEFFTDACLPARLGHADLVLLGCDAVRESGFVNKVGTAALVCRARRERVPAYVLADSFKYLLAGGVRQQRREAREVWRGAPAGVKVQNFYFEEVPLVDCAGFVTEKGLWTPARLRRALRALREPSA